MSRRIVAITIAIVLATFGTVGGLILVLSAEARAQSRISDPVTVAVAAKRIPIGTTGENIRAEEMVRLVQYPRSAVPDDVLSEISVELDKLAVTSTIAPGQLVLRAHFGSPGSATSGLVLPEGRMAVTVQTGAPELVAGYIQAGSEVAIFLTYTVVDTAGDSTDIERTKVLLPRVEVLAVGSYQQARSPNATELSRSSSLLLTLAVTQAEAERLIEGLSHGVLYLGLLSDSVTVTEGPGVDNTDHGGGSLPLFP